MIISISLFVLLFVVFGFSPEWWQDIEARKADTLAWRVSMASAYTCVLLLASTLSMGTFNLLRERPNPTHNPMRRAFGVTSAIYGLLHMIIGVNIHWDGWAIYWQFIKLYRESSIPIGLRVDIFGIANNIGLLQAGLFILLIGLSTNWAMRRLHIHRWKHLQRLSYVMVVLIFIHAMLYQIIEERQLLVRLFFAGIIVFVVVMQAIGAFIHIRKQAITNQLQSQKG